MSSVLHRGCSRFTALKQEDFGHILAVQMKMAGGLIRQGSIRDVHPFYHYFDLNAGSGSEDGFSGSPLIALETARRLRLPFRAWFFEQSATKCRKLAGRIADFRIGYPDFAFESHIIRGDNRLSIDDILLRLGGVGLRIIGLVYSDPYGRPPFRTLRAFSRNPWFSRTDILTYLSATAHKRVLKSPIHDEDLRLDEHLQRLGKRSILIREPVSEHQWTFAFCTNAQKFPRDFRRGFRDVNSSRGRQVLAELSLTNEELRASGIARTRPIIQGTLFR
jgi:three-Cys-motif partner protein